MMFDTFNAPPPRTEYITREVREHRAPTDESVKLLREMEQAADAKRVAMLKLDANSLKGVIEIYQEAHSYRIRARAVFDINGQRHTAEASIDGMQSDGFHKIELMQNLHGEIAKTVAGVVLGDGIKGLKW